MTEKIIAVLWLIGSLFYLFFTQQLAFGTLHSPKAGFLPSLAGVISLSLAVIFIVQLWAKKEKRMEPSVNWTKFIFTILGFLFYLVILSSIGYFVATFVILFYLFKIADTKGWIIPLLLTSGSLGILYLLFDRFLALTLP